MFIFLLHSPRMVKASRRKIYIWYVTLIGFCGTYFFIQVLQLGVHNSLPVELKLRKLECHQNTTDASTKFPDVSTKSPEISSTETLESTVEDKIVNGSTSNGRMWGMMPPFGGNLEELQNPKSYAMDIIKSQRNKFIEMRNVQGNKLTAGDIAMPPPTKKKVVLVKKRTSPPKINFFKSLKDPKLHTKVVNPHEFKFLMHPKDLCKKHPKLYILSVVHSAPNNTVNRNTIRETWGSKSLYSKFRILTLFFLGTSDDKNITKRMLNESMLYGDMVIQDYHDSYRNLTYKAMSWLQWTTTYCPNISFVLKTDDDTFVNLVQFTKLMKRYEKALHGKPSKEIICQKRVNHRVFRKKDFKWKVFQKEYSDDIYPPHCPGFAVILGRDAIPILHNASYYVPFFWIDDVYFTGLLTARTNVRIINISSRYKSMKNSKDLVNGSAIFSYTYRSDNRLHSYWKALEDRYHFT